MSILNFFKKKNKTDEDRFILCLDGGGMRGIVPVMVLQKLESIMRASGADKAFQSYFDFIAGTSTGGLIASSLTFPDKLENVEFNETNQVDFKFLEDTYMSIGKKIFPSSSGLRGIVNVPHQVIGDKYPVAGIESVLSEWFSDTKLNEAKVPTLLMAYNLSEGKEAMLKSYESNDMTVAQACRATSAAPTYFAPLEFEGSLLADGGVTANNPALYAYYEAKKLYPNCTKFHILSLGTAAQIHRTKNDEVSGLINWIDQVSPMYMTAQKQTVEYVLNKMPDVDYLRIDKEFTELIKLDDTKEKSMKSLYEFGLNLASEYEDKLKDFVDKLLK